MRADDAIESVSEAVPESVAPGTGFVIDEIELKGFMRYVERTEPPIRFPEKFTVITGKTGAGKSSILDAITFALYKATTRTDPPANATIDEICKPGGYVRVAFRQGDTRYEVKRGFTSKKEAYLELTRDGEPIGGSIPERERAIRDVVGLDYSGFTNSTFVRQEEMKDLGSQRGSDRLLIFQKLFRLETFERAQELAKERHAEINTLVESQEREIATRAERVSRLPELVAGLEGLKEESAENRARETVLARQTKDAVSRLTELESRHSEYLKAESSISQHAQRVSELDARITTVTAEAERAEQLKAEISLLEDETKDLEALTEEGDRLRELQRLHQLRMKDHEAAYKRRQDFLADHDKKLKQMSEKLFATERRVTDLKTDITKERAFELLREDGALEERLSRIEREIVWLAGRPEILKELDLERRKAGILRERVGEDVAKISGDSFLLSELSRQLDESKAEMRGVNEAKSARLAEFDVELESVDREVARIGFTDDGRKRLGETREALARLQPKRKVLEDAKRTLRASGDASKLLEELRTQAGAVHAELEALQASMADLTTAEHAYVEAKAGLDELQRALSDARSAVARTEGLLMERRRAITELQEDERRNAEAAAKLKSMFQERELLSILKDQVFHKKGVVMYAVHQLLPGLQIEASKNLGDLTDGRFSKIRLETYEEGKGHGIRILVEGVDGLWHDVGEFSGGEKTQINAALRFAIAKELASMPQVGRTYARMKTLFIDEGDIGSLDPAVSRDLFVQKLFRMGEFFDKVILITHIEDVAEKFPGRIRVSMTQEQESRVEYLS